MSFLYCVATVVIETRSFFTELIELLKSLLS